MVRRAGAGRRAVDEAATGHGNQGLAHVPTNGCSAITLKDLTLWMACEGTFANGGSPPAGPGSSSSVTVLGYSEKHCGSDTHTSNTTTHARTCN